MPAQPNTAQAPRRPRLVALQGGAGDPLAGLAADANAALAAVEEHTSAALAAAADCGEALREAKAQLGHGSFGAWLDEHFDGSRRRAQEFMQLSRWAKARRPAHLAGWSVEKALGEIRRQRASESNAAQAIGAVAASVRIRQASDEIRARHGLSPLPPSVAELARERLEAEAVPEPPFADLAATWTDEKGGKVWTTDLAEIEKALQRARKGPDG